MNTCVPSSGWRVVHVSPLPNRVARGPAGWVDQGNEGVGATA